MSTAPLNQFNLPDNECVLNVNNVSDIDVTHLLSTVVNHGYGVIRGLFSPSDIREAKAHIKSNLNPNADHPAMGESANAAMENFQKFIIGGGAQTTYYIPRCVRVIYNPIWAEDKYGMREIFRQLAHVRNHLQGHARDYAVDHIEDDGFWTASRLQQYPIGAGFFMSHQDAVLSQHTEGEGLLKFIQILLLVTQRGEDYERGGAFVRHNGECIDLEATCGAGDIVIYDGRSVHGVADIDPHKLADIHSSSGRIVALASLYTDLTRNKDQYDNYRSRQYEDR